MYSSKGEVAWFILNRIYLFIIAWKRVIIAQGPRQIIAGVTVYALLKSAWTAENGNKYTICTFIHSPILNSFGQVHFNFLLIGIHMAKIGPNELLCFSWVLPVFYGSSLLFRLCSRYSYIFQFFAKFKVISRSTAATKLTSGKLSKRRRRKKECYSYKSQVSTSY